MMRLPGIITALIVVTTQVFAQAPIIAHLETGQSTINETLKPNAPVAGGFDVVGASFGHTGSEGDATNLYIRVPSDWKASPVCVEITSRNSLYEAADVFDVPAAPRGSFIKLDFKTRYPTWYRSATRDTFAVTAREGMCHTFGGRFLPVVWSALTWDAGVKLLLAVQTGRTKVSALVVQGSISSKIKCDLLQVETYETAFDATCSIPLQAHDADRMTVQIEKCAMGECGKGEIITLGL